MIRNWKTTLAGIASILTGVSKIVNDGAITAEAFGLIVAGIGLIFGKDFNGK